MNLLYFGCTRTQLFESRSKYIEEFVDIKEIIILISCYSSIRNITVLIVHRSVCQIPGGGGGGRYRVVVVVGAVT